jgi:predicted XRE-type DNA-binding protein
MWLLFTGSNTWNTFQDQKYSNENIQTITESMNNIAEYTIKAKYRQSRICLLMNESQGRPSGSSQLRLDGSRDSQVGMLG